MIIVIQRIMGTRVNDTMTLPNNYIQHQGYTLLQKAILRIINDTLFCVMHIQLHTIHFYFIFYSMHHTPFSYHTHQLLSPHSYITIILSHDTKHEDRSVIDPISATKFRFNSMRITTVMYDCYTSFYHHFMIYLLLFGLLTEIDEYFSKLLLCL